MGFSFFGVLVRFGLTAILLAYISFVIGYARSGRVAGGLLVAVLTIVSLPIHERMHVLVASRFRIACRGIVVMGVGGAAQLTSTGNRPREVLAIAGIGPLTSAALAFGLAYVSGFLMLGTTLERTVSLRWHG